VPTFTVGVEANAGNVPEMPNDVLAIVGFCNNTTPLRCEELSSDVVTVLVTCTFLRDIVVLSFVTVGLVNNTTPLLLAIVLSTVAVTVGKVDIFTVDREKVLSS